MGIETTNHDLLLQTTLTPDTYVRMQVNTNAELDSFSKSDIAAMIEDGKRMFNEPLAPASKEQLLNILREIIDEKFT